MTTETRGVEAPALTPSVRSGVYLMPQNTANVAWEFHVEHVSEWAAQAANVAQHVECYAFPWMNRYQALGDILRGLDEGLSLYAQDQRPVALMLLGRRDEALRSLEGHLHELANRADPAADNFRRFADGLRAELNARSPPNAQA